MREILVLGGGPAGVAAAVGLRRLGYDVAVVGEARVFTAVEGISERVVSALENASFATTVRSLPAPSPRRVTWNGTTSAANTERLIERQSFDRMLLHDAARQGVHVLHGRVTKCAAHGAGFIVRVESGGECRQIAAGFIVEARGRAAPANAGQRLRGAETVSLLQYRQGMPAAPHSAVQSFADGWAWMASTANGRRYLQLTFDVASSRFPPKRLLPAYCTRRLMRLEAARPYLEASVPIGKLHARTSTPILGHAVVGDNWIRVGDAAMAVDPLSGNGIFQALSSALQAPAVVNTLIRRPAQTELARRFHEQRIAGLFFRFARIGRDFYAQEGRWVSEFWQRRRCWPDATALHPAVTPEQVDVRPMPVVRGDFIEEAEVVVTPDQPLGVWHLHGRPLAPVLRALREVPSAPLAQRLARLPDGDDPELVRMAWWMHQQGWL